MKHLEMQGMVVHTMIMHNMHHHYNTLYYVVYDMEVIRYYYIHSERQTGIYTERERERDKRCRSGTINTLQ